MKMTFYKILNKGVSKNTSKLIADEIIKTPKRFDDLLQEILADKKGTSWRAAYVLDLLCDKDFSFFEKNKEELIDFLFKTKDASIHRHLCKLSSRTEIPKEKHGVMLNFCTKKIFSDKVRVAVKVHCIEIFYNISIEQAELKQELELIINEVIDNNTVAFSCRAKKILKKLKNN